MEILDFQILTDIIHIQKEKESKLFLPEYKDRQVDQDSEFLFGKY